MKKIRVGIKKVDKPIKFIEIEDTIEKLQEIVDGYIDIFTTDSLAEIGIDIILNDEGKLRGMDTNIALTDGKNDQLLDVIVGDIIFAGHDSFGNTISLTDEQCMYIEMVLNSTEIIMLNNLTDRIEMKPVIIY